MAGNTCFFPKGRRFEMSKKTRKQPPKPNARRGEATVHRTGQTSDPETVPDLSHIAEALRPLAIPCSSLNPDPDNARLHSEENIEAIMKSLAEFGQDQPLVVQKQGMIVRTGNGRLQAAGRLGWKWIAAFVVDEDDVRAVARAIADNRAAELATWDEEKLAQLLQSIREVGEIDLEVTGFSQADIDQLLPLDIPQDEVPEPPDDPLTRPGDLWKLGNHRLLCANASIPEDVDRLLDGAPVHLVSTDPPYNVKVEPRSNNAIAAGLSSFVGARHQLIGHPMALAGRGRVRDHRADFCPCEPREIMIPHVGELGLDGPRFPWKVTHEEFENQSVLRFLIRTSSLFMTRFVLMASCP
jgi:hypothetical protein